MADELEILEFLEADYALNKQNKARKRRRMQLRQKSDPFSLDEEEFIRRYRLTKALAHEVCDELKPLFKKPLKSTDLSVETKVLIALSFYASGSHQRPLSSNEGHSVAQQTASSAISQVTAAFNSEHIRQKYINFPATDQERKRIQTEFLNKFHIPGVLGCIDCSHIALTRPSQHQERYYNRKGYHSLNVQFICDANMDILNVDASHGGASHDSFIWINHPLKSHMENLSNTDNIWFLGDPQYPLTKTMMTPILDASPNSPEAHYTDLHVRATDTIERTIRLLKARFRCLLGRRVLHYSPDVVSSIVNACVILHNICNRAKAPVQDLSDEDLLHEAELQDAAIEPPGNNKTASQEELHFRNSLVQMLWERQHSIP